MTRPRSVVFAGPFLGSHPGMVPSPMEQVFGRFSETGFSPRVVSTQRPVVLRAADTVVQLVRWLPRADALAVMAYAGRGFMFADLATRLGRVFGVPTLVVLHSGAFIDFAPTHRRWFDRVLASADLVGAPSEHLLQLVAGKRTMVLPNAVNIPDRMVRKDAGHRVLWMRTYHWWYRPALAVEVLAHLRKLIPDVTMSMFGQDEGERESVLTLVRAKGCGDVVTVGGFLDQRNKAAVFAAHDVYLHTNLVDNAPVSIIEAQANGLPVVGCDVGGVRALTGESASLVSSSDPAHIASALADVLNSDALSTRLRLAGRANAERFAWESVREDWNRALMALTDRPVTVISHKIAHRTEHGSVLTDGGFPRHMAGLATRAARLRIALDLREANGSVSGTELPLQAEIVALNPPTTVRGVVGIIGWLRYFRRCRRVIKSSSAVHIVGPSAASLVALNAALTTQTPYSFRHCGQWGTPRSRTEALLERELRLLARRGATVLATGARDDSPSVTPVFSTSLWSHEIDELRPVEPRKPSQPLRCITVGRLTQGKRVGIAIECVAELARRGKAVTLEVVGDGPEAAALGQLAAALDAPVTFHGQLPWHEVMTLTQHSNVMLFPTASEGFPKAVVESQACGVPVVYSSDAQLDHVVDGGGIAALSDPRSFADAVEALVVPDRYEWCSSRSLALARSRSLEHWAETISTACHWTPS